MPELEYLLRFAEASAPSTWYYVASTHGRSTTSTDTPASTYVPPGLPDLNFQVSLFPDVDPVAPRPEGGFGSIVLPNVDGRFDWLIGMIVDGGTLELRRNTVGVPYVDFITVARMTAAGVQHDGETLAIRLRDLGWLLSTPLHDNRYGGTGGADGDATVTGRLKPYLVGRCFGVTPALVDPIKLIWQLNDGPIDGIELIHEGRSTVDIPPEGDVANYAALDAATVTPGYYQSCLAEGYFRLGSAPTLGLTATVRGDKASGTYIDERGDIINRIVTRAGTVLSSVDSASITALNALGEQCGFFWDREISKAEALAEVLSGISGFWWIDLTGKLKFGALALPTGTAARTFTFPNECGLPASTGYATPRWKTTLGYQRNYTVQRDADFAGSVATSPELKTIYMAEARYTTAETAGQRTYWPTSPEVKKFSGYFREDEATPEAARQAAMFAGRPTNARNITRYRMPFYVDAYALMAYLGQVVAIAGLTRFGWSSPQKFLMVGVETLPGSRMAIGHLWG